MNNKLKTIILLIAFALFIGLAVLGYNLLGEKVAPPGNNLNLTQEEPEGENNQEGKQGEQDESQEKIKAPDFTVLDANSDSVKLSDLLGKPIVLNFWASWCPPCKSEMPDFEKVYQELGEDITFMMVDLIDGQRETQEKGVKYVKDQGFSFPVYFDTKQDAANKYGISSIPTTFFIDKEGYVAAVAQSAIDEETLRQGIDLIK